MPTRTRPFDLLARSGQDVPSAAAGPGEPPGPARVAGSLGTAEEPPGAGLRLVAVPDGWPPYDCETHGAVCPAAAPVPPAAPVSARAAAPGADGPTIPSGEAAPREKAALRGATERGD